MALPKATLARATLACSVLVLFACGPRLEEETLLYEERVAALGRHIRRYPNFQKHLTAAVTEARAIRRLSAQVRDPEKKAELLARANRRMHSDLAVELDAINNSTKEVRKAIRVLGVMRLNPSDRERASNQSKEARAVLKAALTDLSKTEEGDQRSALKAARFANRRLSDALEELQALQRIFETRLQ